MRGWPNTCIQLSTNTLATVWAFWSGNANARLYFEKWSVMHNTTVLPDWLLLSGPTMSIDTRSLMWPLGKALLGACAGRFGIFRFWHTAHVRIHQLTSWSILNQWTDFMSKRIARRLPKCAVVRPSCTSSHIACLSALGTRICKRVMVPESFSQQRYKIPLCSWRRRHSAKYALQAGDCML